MVIIIKSKNSNLIKVLKLSQIGYSRECRIFDIVLNKCLDDSELSSKRTQFYRILIDSLVENSFAIKPWSHTEVPNTLHDRLIRFFDKDLKVKVFEFILNDPKIELWFDSNFDFL